MAQFNDVLNLFGDDLPEGVADKLISAYDEDMTIPTAKVNELEGDISARDAKIAELKSQNYDLIRSGIGAGSSSTEPPAPTVEHEEEKRKTINDFFQ